MTQVDLLPKQGVDSLSNKLFLLFSLVRSAESELGIVVLVGIVGTETGSSSEMSQALSTGKSFSLAEALELSELSELMNTLAESYSLLSGPRLTTSTSLEALTTRAFFT